jgi:hypothetical protein
MREWIMSQSSRRESRSAAIKALHAEGRHIDAEWERLKVDGARWDATEEDLASHRLTFFLGALSVWQAIQHAKDETVVDELQAEIESFLADMEDPGHVTVTSDSVH